MSVLIKDFGFVLPRFQTNGFGVSGSSRFSKSFFNQSGEVRLSITRPVTRASNGTNGSLSTEPGPVVRRKYRVNASRIRAKARAFAMLESSASFLAFYSVSFPAGLDDDLCYKAWNIALTRCRVSLGLKSYLWVMERQKNGTIHYHMLTNDFLHVRKFNGYVAASIESFVRKGLASWGASSMVRYNGVDVKLISARRSKRRPKPENARVFAVVRYLAKYMSKELQSDSHRVWHCSRFVSALATGYWISEADMRDVCESLEAEGKPFRAIVSEYAHLVFAPVVSCDLFQKLVVSFNNFLYRYFSIHNLF